MSVPLPPDELEVSPGYGLPGNPEVPLPGVYLLGLVILLAQCGTRVCLTRGLDNDEG